MRRRLARKVMRGEGYRRGTVLAAIRRMGSVYMDVYMTILGRWP